MQDALLPGQPHGVEVTLQEGAEVVECVRRRAYPSSSEEVPVSVRRKGEGANPSSSEVHRDDVEGHLENVRKRAGVQSLFLRRSRSRRCRSRWTWGVESLSPHPQWECPKTPNTHATTSRRTEQLGTTCTRDDTHSVAVTTASGSGEALIRRQRTIFFWDGRELTVT